MDRKMLFSIVPGLQTVATSANKNTRAKAALSQKLEGCLLATEQMLPIILLIEPNAAVAKQEQSVLRGFAHVLVAQTAHEALNLLEQMGVMPRLIVTRSQGIAAVSVLKTRGYTGPVLFLADPGVDTHAWQYINFEGAVLESPLKLTELAATARRWLKKGE